MRRFMICMAMLALTALTPQSLYAAPLEEVEALQNRSAAPLIIDIRSPKAYSAGHIQSALNAPYGMWRGPRNNPGQMLDDEKITTLLRALGVTGNEDIIVAHQGEDASDFGAAARVYWTRKSAVLTRISILNGVVDAWTDRRLPLSPHAPPTPPTTISVSLSPRWTMTRDDVADVIAGRSDARMIDARPLDFFEGRKKHKAAASAGTLPGALNVIHSSWFGQNEKRMSASPETVRAILARAGYDGALRPEETLVSFCNTGHWAATNWFALSEIAGIENVKLYPESMVGWTNAGGAVATGN